MSTKRQVGWSDFRKVNGSGDDSSEYRAKDCWFGWIPVDWENGRVYGRWVVNRSCGVFGHYIILLIPCRVRVWLRLHRGRAVLRCALLPFSLVWEVEGSFKQRQAKILVDGASRSMPDIDLLTSRLTFTVLISAGRQPDW